MKKLFAILMILAIPCLSMAGQSDVTLGWDAYLKADCPDLASILIFKRAYPDGAYQYGSPAATVNQAFNAAGSSTPVRTAIKVDWPENTITRYAFVARAVDKIGNQSDNSNEVVWTAPATNDVKPPAVNDLRAVYDRNANAINCYWTQPAGKVTGWQVYSRPVGGKYALKATVQWNGTDTKLTKSIAQDVPEGSQQTIELIVVAFNGNLYSKNSNMVRVNIDRKSPGKTINLRLVTQ